MTPKYKLDIWNPGNYRYEPYSQLYDQKQIKILLNKPEMIYVACRVTEITEKKSVVMNREEIEKLRLKK